MSEGLSEEDALKKMLEMTEEEKAEIVEMNAGPSTPVKDMMVKSCPTMVVEESGKVRPKKGQSEDTFQTVHGEVARPPFFRIITSVQTNTPMGLSKASIIDCLRESYGETVTSAEIKAFCQMNDFNYQTITNKLTDFKVGRGKWNLEVTKETVQELEVTYNAPAAMPAVEQNLIPQKDDSFVKFGNFGDIKKIIQSRLFYPTFITGLSGNGKTFSVEQACAQLGRELIRVNITIETDEDDLIGGFRLVDGSTVWHNGPVVEALERGAILLLDEIDLASNKILCLQSILEGKGVFLKKIGKRVDPAVGFNVIATANTKGKGSDDGRFIGTNVLNEAFLERFPVTFEQDYPTVATERKILCVSLLPLVNTMRLLSNTSVTGLTSSARPSSMVVSKI